MAEARETAEEQPAQQPVLARADAVAPAGVSLQAGISFSPAAVVALQRAAGNRAVSGLLSRSARQRHAVGGAVAEGVAEEELDELGRRVGGTGTTEMRVTRQPLAVQRELAIAPTVPDAPAPVLTEAEIERAIRYNERRFVDPFTVSFVRDVLGVPKYPAVSDRDLALAAARYQADFGLTPDGRIGAATTRRLVDELNAEDQRRLARLLRADNMVTWTDVNAANWTGCGQFQWDVNFTTTLRDGWLIQRIDNTWNATACGPGGGDVTPPFTRRYWEAWWVDGNGNILLPTSTGQPPSTTGLAVAHDLWRNPSIPGSRGTWSQAGTMFTTLTLPPGFQIHGANSAPESVDLPSTRGPIDSDLLGLPLASRRVAGRWDCCDPDPANHFHRPA